MKRLILVCAVALLTFSTVTSPILAADDHTVRPVDPTQTRIYDPSRVPVTCLVGNLEPIAYAVSGWLAPPDKYALIFDPGAACQDCDVGVRITTVHTMLQTSAACDMVIKVSLLSVDAPPVANCPAPLNVLCGHYEWSVSLPSEGTWDISLPLDCLCADPDYLFALKVKITGADCVDGGLPNLITDERPTACTSYNEIDGVWTDLVTTYGFPGNLSIWADAECCWSPVGLEARTWSDLKAIYR